MQCVTKNSSARKWFIFKKISHGMAQNIVVPYRNMGVVACMPVCDVRLQNCCPTANKVKKANAPRLLRICKYYLLTLPVTSVSCEWQTAIIDLMNSAIICASMISDRLEGLVLPS